MQGEKKIEKYQFNLKKQLGQGSYATVYLGRSLDTSEAVAVKVIDKKIFSNAYNVKNIQSEIDIMKKVSHCNIVKLHDIYQTTNNMYIVTELCQDGDLMRKLQRKKRLHENEAKGLLRDIMSGVKYLHKNGIIHRDLKPANILLKKGVCKLSDFGFAKSLNSEDTVMKSIVGTPLYMSPQILKKAKYTAKSDLWSIGLVYYEMLHGRTPWPAQNQLELINGIYHKKVAFSNQVSQKSRNFIRRCLEIEEEHRISWEQAFNHPLLREQPQRRISKPVLEIERIVIPEDKENSSNLHNNVKTPSRKTPNGDKSPTLFRKNRKEFSDIKLKKAEKAQQSCLTPKARTMSKVTPTKSGIRQQLTVKKEKQLSTRKKKPKKQVCLLQQRRLY